MRLCGGELGTGGNVAKGRGRFHTSTIIVETAEIIGVHQTISKPRFINTDD
jgi:hypothetical protein